jgi:glutamyl-tRNA reductase
MTFFVLGLNHETAPVAVRQAFALDAEAQRHLYRTLARSQDAELILLSTCNRTEAYLYGTTADVLALRKAMSHRAGTDWPEDASFLYEDEDAVRHVLQVTAGLRSMVLGDAQILAQVKDAYRLADDENCVDTLMHRLMHTAFRTAKRVISETALTSGTASVASAAVAAARDYFAQHALPGLTGRRVLLVGAGQMGQLALEALASYGLAETVVVNRSPERAQTLADKMGARTVAWAERHAAVQDADVVLVATGAPEPVLTAEHLPARPDAPTSTLLLDIAVPRNVDPALDTQPGYAVIDLDTLNARCDQARTRRRSDVPEAAAICEEALNEYVTWVFHQQGLQPAIQAIRETFEAIRVQEIERHHHRFSETDRDQLDRITRSILQKLLAVPIVRLKSVDPDSIDFVRGIKLLHGLFSRPTCEDESAQQAQQQDVTLKGARQVNSPGRCPFETHDGALSEDVEETLRAALRLPSSDADAEQ